MHATIIRSTDEHRPLLDRLVTDLVAAARAEGLAVVANMRNSQRGEVELWLGRDNPHAPPVQGPLGVVQLPTDRWQTDRPRRGAGTRPRAVPA